MSTAREMKQYQDISQLIDEIGVHGVLGLMSRKCAYEANRESLTPGMRKLWRNTSITLSSLYIE